LESAEIEIKIKKIAFDIIKRYLNKRLLVVFTGGTIGFAEAMNEIKRALLDNELGCDVLFSKPAAQIHDVTSISKELNAEKIIVEGIDTIKSFKDFLGRYSAIVVGVLTRSSASKLARLYLDTYAVQTIINSLMMGIPVMSAVDAADPKTEGWENIGFMWANGALKNAFGENINTLTGYGVKFCKAKDLYPEITSLYFYNCIENTLAKPNFDVIRLERKVVTRDDIVLHLKEGCKFSIPKNAVITPFALDVIKENNICVSRE